MIAEVVPAALDGRAPRPDRRVDRRRQPLRCGRTDRRRRCVRRRRRWRVGQGAPRPRAARRGRSDALPTVPSCPAPTRRSSSASSTSTTTVIVVDKPAGLVVHPGAGNPDGTLVNGLLARFPELADVGEAHPSRHRPPPRRRQLRPARRRPHAGRRRRADRAVRRPQRHAARYDGARVGRTRRAARDHRRADRRDPATRCKMAVVANGDYARTEYRVIGQLLGPGRRVAARVPAGDRPDPPDPRPPRARSVIRSSATRPTASAARCSD